MYNVSRILCIKACGPILKYILYDIHVFVFGEVYVYVKSMVVVRVYQNITDVVHVTNLHVYII